MFQAAQARPWRGQKSGAHWPRNIGCLAAGKGPQSRARSCAGGREEGKHEQRFDLLSGLIRCAYKFGMRSRDASSLLQRQLLQQDLAGDVEHGLLTVCWLRAMMPRIPTMTTSDEARPALLGTEARTRHPTRAVSQEETSASTVYASLFIRLLDWVILVVMQPCRIGWECTLLQILQCARLSGGAHPARGWPVREIWGAIWG